MPDDPNSNLGANSPEAAQTPATDTPGAPDAAASPEAAPAPAPQGKPLTWPSWYPGVDSAIAGLVLVLAFVAASFVARNSDVWIHLAAGKRLFQGEYFPGGKDPFSYTGADRTWVNHSWLTDAAAYLLYGGEGKVLVVAKAIVITLAFGVLLALRRPQHSLWPWAVVTAVAVLAAAPQFILRPHVVSMLFLAITLYILFRMPRGTNPWQLPIAIGITFWLWANCDPWFILGPIALVLLILGELIQKYALNSPDAAESGADNEPLSPLPNLDTLAKALGVGVVACMLNPHHVRVWELPFELIGAEGARDEPRLRFLFTPVFTYYSSAGLGRNLNGAAFAILALVGAALLGLSYGRVRGSHVALWIGFLALALFRVSTIPFFAIVAVPIIAAQLNAISSQVELKTWGDPQSRLLWIGSSLGRVVCVLGVAALCVLAYPGWIHPDATNPAYARRLAWGVEPDPLLKNAAEQLNRWREQEKLPPAARGIIASTDLANYVAWYAPREKVFLNARYNHHKPELANYVKLRRGLKLVPVTDAPLTLKAAAEVMKDAGAEYLAVSVAAGEGPSGRAAAQQVTVALYASQDIEDLRMMRAGEWSPWYLDGQTVVFGWRAEGEKGKPEFAALRLDPVTFAFSPDTRPLEQFEPRGLPPELGWEEPFVRPARPAPPAVAEAMGWLMYHDGLQRRLGQLGQFQQDVQILRAELAGSAFAHSAPHKLLTFTTMVARGPGPLPPSLAPPTTEPSGAVNSARAVAILALRAARRAIRENPDHPDPYFVLALALRDPNLPLTDGERTLSIVTAYRQCLARLPKPERYKRNQYLASPREVAYQLAGIYLGQEITGRPDPKTKQPTTVGFTGMPMNVAPLNLLLGQAIFEDSRGKIIHKPIAELNQKGPPANSRLISGDTTFYLAADAALEAAQQAMQYALIELAGETPDVVQKEMEKFETLLKKAENQVVRSTEDFERVKPRSPKLPEMVFAAAGYSLPKQAIELFSDKSKEEVQKEYGPMVSLGLVHQYALYIVLGRGDEVAANLNDPEQVGVERDPVLERMGLKGGMQLLRYQDAVLLGDYKLAGEIRERGYQNIGVEAMLDNLAKNNIGPNSPVAAEVNRHFPAVAVGGGYLPAFTFYWSALQRSGLMRVVREEINSKLQQDSNYFYDRGRLAILEGDIRSARQWLGQAYRKAPAGWNLRDVHNPNAEVYVKLIDIAEKKMPK